ncbi:hypothetical protein [Pseudoalteromonas sp. T1lg48]|uniref:hypothetical protein n=1 Tax=Pseudoalteromonas sp. T1lg48 TaxID=2077100 RepID=UPI000CF68D19|nr:hypothetical protein [Pseudoalteromonas sp. T1lg48]
MKNITTKAFAVSLLMASTYGQTEDADKTLRLDNTPFKNSEIYCENDKELHPFQNEFELLDYYSMSSDEGERQVIVTVENSSSGGRSLNHTHFVAILGNCEHINPMKFERKFNGKEIVTLTLNFGFSKFPILKVINQP